jgi:hypothetical protein
MEWLLLSHRKNLSPRKLSHRAASCVEVIGSRAAGQFPAHDPAGKFVVRKGLLEGVPRHPPESQQFIRCGVLKFNRKRLQYIESKFQHMKIAAPMASIPFFLVRFAPLPRDGWKLDTTIARGRKPSGVSYAGAAILGMNKTKHALSVDCVESLLEKTRSGKV